MAKKGNKSKYKDYVQPHLAKIIKWRQEGKTEEWCFTKLGISKSAWIKYKKEYPEFKKAVIQGKEELLSSVESSFYEQCVGNERKGIKPNLTAQIFFLKVHGGWIERDKKLALDLREREVIAKEKLSVQLEQILTDPIIAEIAKSVTLEEFDENITKTASTSKLKKQ